MVNVDIYRNSKSQQDIIVLDMERYISLCEFNYMTRYLSVNLPNYILKIYNSEMVEPCLDYDGIMFQLSGLLDDRKTAKLELTTLCQSMLDSISH